MSTVTARRARPRVNPTHFMPPKEAQHAPITIPPPEYAHKYEPERDEEDEDIEALEFEAAILARSAGSAIPVPGAEQLNLGLRPPLPLGALHALDAHVWAREPGLLSMWARGAGVGAFANNFTDEMIAPGSPPRPRVNVRADTSNC